MTITPPSDEVLSQHIADRLRLHRDPDVVMTHTSAELDHATAQRVRPRLLRWFASNVLAEQNWLRAQLLDLADLLEVAERKGWWS